MRVIGLMSGTSYDAIDAAAAELTVHGDTVVLSPLGALSVPYPLPLREAVEAALPPASTTMEQVCRLDTGIGQAFAAAAARADEQLCARTAELVVSHGQTVFHWVESGRARGTLQLGQPAWIAEHTGLPVVADLRARDVAAGGQGAPLVSLFDVLWLGSRPGTPVALNLGGIANITVVCRDGDPVAFDTGPANAPVSAVSGGRLIYVGAGTSGRLGVLDAAECPPTFGTDRDQVVGLIAGGVAALVRAVEGAEDSPELGERDLRALALTEHDVVVGLAASGRTPYVVGALDHARDIGAATVSVACNLGSAVSAHAQVAIEIDNGPEVLTGSTRLKAGTSQKLVLNMLSTAAMIQLGKVYDNLMVDVVPTNAKLTERAQRIIATATGVDASTAAEYYGRAGGRPKTAIVMILADIDRDEAERRLARSGGLVRGALTP